ncbi:MAG TPA: DUF3196 family protein [Erysipelotrichaceae bacterium]|nr:DUF3196 family protein [Erysipelotrichia bacterium]HPX33021.1 DUF3196 family protein [Erysipelotrichaceae bacterium]HQA85723.1 DUF3196 family protein [Erysipelotrichaceae bacterium]
MAVNYYQTIVNHIEKLIESNDFIMANKLIEEELSMPYVPQDVLMKLQQLHDICKFNLNEEKKSELLSPEEVYEYLKLGSEKAYKALETLSMANIRNYLAVVKEILVDNAVNRVLKSLLIEQLQIQQISNIINFTIDDRVYSIIPSQIPSPLSQSNFAVISKNLEKIIESNPSFLQQCQMVLINVVYDNYPFLIKDEDVDKITYSVIAYVYKAYQDEEGLKKFLKEHQINIEMLDDFTF